MLELSGNKILNLKYLPEIFVKLSEMFIESSQRVIGENFFIAAT